jgi:ryanodine receptor 2
MNRVLGYILKIISNNFEEKQASWMNRIASFSQSIISNSTPDLLKNHFLPLSFKICEKVNELYEREISLRYLTRNLDSTDREEFETELQIDFEILIRNIYTFYPLLIKYVDLHRAYWLKNPDDDSEQLYYHISEVFNIWLKSKMFKKEELNFVNANEIDNMLLIMPAASNAISSQAASNTPAPTGGKNNKKRKTKGAKKKFTSLIVACLKRLFQIGINFFGGKEQEIIQMSKQKLIEIYYSSTDNTNQEDGAFELSTEIEETVEEFIKCYMKSSDVSDMKELTGADVYSENEFIDKDTYQKTKWQRMLYRKISSKRNVSSDKATVVKRIMEISKVLFGLYMVEHPQVKNKGMKLKKILRFPQIL